jgi:hypothetical protein
MATIQIDPVSGLPIIPKEWLTVNRSPGSWNEGLGVEQFLQNVGFTPEAFAALEQAGFGNGSNYQWGYGSDQGNWQQDSSMGDLTNPVLQSVMKKTGDKEGTKYGYTLDANGNYVPSATGQAEYWDTNRGDMNLKAAIAMASLLGGGMGANYGMTGNFLTAAAPTGMGDLGVNALLGTALTDGSIGGLAGGAGAAGSGASALTGEQLGAGWVGEDLAGAAAAGATTPAGFTTPAGTIAGAAGSAAGAAGGPPKPTTGAGGGFQMPTDLAGWLKLAAPLLGGGLAAWEASKANGEQNPQDAFTRDWARNKLNNPQAAPQAVTGQYRDKMMGLLGQQNPAIAGLLGKRYY